MKMGMVISSNDAETCWNALRFANYSLGQKDTVRIFLIGKGVEYERVSTPQYNISEQAQKFVLGGGAIHACGTCIKSRGQQDSPLCPISSMKDLYEIVKESDKVVTF
jgi:sulfur relay (sulfurtransferase) complex TusBCD TusD component (DsrE family)